MTDWSAVLVGIAAASAFWVPAGVWFALRSAKAAVALTQADTAAQLLEQFDSPMCKDRPERFRKLLKHLSEK